MFRSPKSVVLLLAFVTCLTAQTVPDQYIVQLSGEPAILKTGAAGDTGRVRQAMTARRSVVRSQQLRVRQAIGSKGKIVDSVELIANAMIVDSTDPDALRAIPGVARVLPVYEIKLNLDAMAQVHRVREAWARIGGQGNAGAGIKIGILDTGIDKDHAGFQDETLPALAGYPKVSDEPILASMSRKIIAGRQYDQLNRTTPSLDIEDRFGHGTAVAMVAAGVTNNGPYGLITGFAPKAYLGVYRIGNGSSTNGAILKAMDDAVSDGMDVINLSSGNSVPVRSDLNILVDAADRAAAAGSIVIFAGGNEGPDAFTVSSDSVGTTAISAGASYSSRQFAAGIKVEDQTVLGIAGSGPTPAQAISASMVDAAVVDPTGLLCSPTSSSGLQGKVVLILRGDCTFETKLNNAQLAGAVSGVVFATAALPEAIGMGVGSALLPSMMVSNGDGVSLKNRIRGGTTVGTLQFEGLVVSQESRRAAQFSSRGPSVDISIKPDLLAVGTNVSTATQSKFRAGGMYNSRGYTVIQGTSFSAPAMAGAMAVLKAARPGLSPKQYRSMMVNSAAPFILADGKVAPVMMAGSGLLDLNAAVQTNTALAPVSVSFGAGDQNPDRSRDIEVTNLGQDPDTFTMSVSSTDSMLPAVTPATLSIPAGESRKVTLSFRGKNIANGEYQGFLKINAANSQVESRMAYWYAAPTNVPAKVTMVRTPSSGRINSSQTFLFILLDATGIPITNETPKITVTTGDGSVGDLESYDPELPGVWAASVRLGVTAGTNVFQIESKDAKREVTIVGQ